MKTEPLYTASRLSLLTRLDRRAVEKRLIGVPVAKLVGTARHYKLEDALPALCLSQEDADAAARAAGTKEKNAIIDFQNRELDQMKKLREVALLDHCTAYVQEERIAFRQIIMHAEFLNDSQKKRLLDKCKAIKTTPPEPVEA